MQYSCSLDRHALTTLVVERFLGALAGNDVDAVLDCLHDCAHFCVQTHFMTASGKKEIGDALGRYSGKGAQVSVAELEPIVDAKNGRVAVVCAIRPQGSSETQSNTLFFRVRDDRIQDIYFYVSGENLFS